MGLFNRQQNNEQTVAREQQDFLTKQNSIAVADKLDEQVMLKKIDDDKDLVRWQQQLGDELEELKHALKREEWNGEKWTTQEITVGHDRQGKPIKEIMPPLMNEAGIKMVEAQVRPLLSRNMINTNLNEDLVYGMLRRTSDTIVNNMATYGQAYEIEFGNYSHIIRLIKNFIIPTPFRALNDGERKHLRTMNKRVEAFTQADNAEPKKRRWF